jgi:TATA-binding protein-associated factor Taf7
MRGSSSSDKAAGIGLDGKRGSSNPLWSEYDHSSGMAGMMSSAEMDMGSARGSSKENEEKKASKEKKTGKNKDKKDKSKDKKDKKNKKDKKDKKSKKSKNHKRRRTLADEFASLTEKERASRLRRLKYVTTRHDQPPPANSVGGSVAVAAAAQ